jgi:hypothetical protein
MFPRIYSLVLIAVLLLVSCGTPGPTTSSNPSPQATPAPSATTGPPEPSTFSEQARISAPADGAAHADASGAVVTVAPAAVEHGGKLELIAASGAGWLIQQLDGVATRETPFYALQLSGADDSRQPVELRLPAAGPNSRVAALVDGSYLFVYGVEPTGGSLTIRVNVPPASPPDLGGDPIAVAGSSQYFVIGPRAASIPLWDRLAGVSVAQAQAAGYRNCIIFGDIPVELSTCRSNASGSVQASWGQSGLITNDTADAVIAAAEQGMQSLVGVGLEAAKISGLSPVKIVIKPGDFSPSYNSTLGVISIGATAATKIGGDSSRLELWHELMHWVQDENYTMLWGFVNGDLRWWLEASAEVGVFMADPAAVDPAATLYGRSTMSDMRTLVFQLSPYQWAADEMYLHAQLVRANICASGCPLTKESFAAAINAGDYPFQDTAKRAELRKNLDRYARYVLTGKLDSEMVAAFSGGGQVGDYVALSNDSGSPFKVDTASYPPQIDKKTGVIEAPLQPDSVYPLLVGSGAGAEPATGYAKAPGHPAMLTVQPGVELYYSLNGGEPVHHDGSKQLIIAPIHQVLGYPQLRLVAVARDAPVTFKAKIEPADLSGDWVFTIKSAELISNSCAEEGDDSSSSTASQSADILNQLSLQTALRGTYAAPDKNLPGKLEFALAPGQTLKTSPDDPEATYVATITVGEKDVLSDMELTILPPTQASAPDPGAPEAGLALALAVPPGLALLLRKRRRGAAILLTLLAVTMLSGCLGLNISGTIGSELRFTKLEYVALPDATDKPLWRLSDGSGTLDLDLTIIVAATTLDPNSPEGASTQTETRHCVAQVKVTSIGELYPDGVVQAPATE